MKKDLDNHIQFEKEEKSSRTLLNKKKIKRFSRFIETREKR